MSSGEVESSSRLRLLTLKVEDFGVKGTCIFERKWTECRAEMRQDLVLETFNISSHVTAWNIWQLSLGVVTESSITSTSLEIRAVRQYVFGRQAMVTLTSSKSPRRCSLVTCNNLLLMVKSHKSYCFRIYFKH